MSRRIFCDGCDRILATSDVALHGQRQEGAIGADATVLPMRDFHLCVDCAVVGFPAMARAQADGSRHCQTCGTPWGTPPPPIKLTRGV